MNPSRRNFLKVALASPLASSLLASPDQPTTQAAAVSATPAADWLAGNYWLQVLHARSQCQPEPEENWQVQRALSTPQAMEELARSLAAEGTLGDFAYWWVLGRPSPFFWWGVPNFLTVQRLPSEFHYMDQDSGRRLARVVIFDDRPPVPTPCGKYRYPSIIMK